MAEGLIRRVGRELDRDVLAGDRDDLVPATRRRVEADPELDVGAEAGAREVAVDDAGEAARDAAAGAADEDQRAVNVLDRDRVGPEPADLDVAEADPRLLDLRVGPDRVRAGGGAEEQIDVAVGVDVRERDRRG